MNFTKMHGIGNDYIYMNVMNCFIENAPELAVKLSDRHTGIGSDGLILIAPSDIADFRMVMYNADGSEGAMCGNGIRCVGKYVFDHGLTDKREVDIETKSGVKRLVLDVDEASHTVSNVTVNMGSPILCAEDIPTLLDDGSGTAIKTRINVAGGSYLVSCVSMGNPHCVVFQDEDVKKLELPEIGPFWEHHKMFPDRINTEFANVLDRKTIRMRVWERGSGETMACGTGACATAVAAILNDLTDHEVTLKLLGGDLKISWAGGDAPVYMTGPATEVYEGFLKEL